MSRARSLFRPPFAGAQDPSGPVQTHLGPGFQGRLREEAALRVQRSACGGLRLRGFPLASACRGPSGRGSCPSSSKQTLLLLFSFPAPGRQLLIDLQNSLVTISLFWRITYFRPVQGQFGNTSQVYTHICAHRHTYTHITCAHTHAQHMCTWAHTSQLHVHMCTWAHIHHSVYLHMCT